MGPSANTAVRVSASSGCEPCRGGAELRGWAGRPTAAAQKGPGPKPGTGQTSLRGVLRGSHRHEPAAGGSSTSDTSAAGAAQAARGGSGRKGLTSPCIQKRFFASSPQCSSSSSFAQPARGAARSAPPFAFDLLIPLLQRVPRGQQLPAQAAPHAALGGFILEVKTNLRLSEFQ